jgi:hypothetical protein
MKDRQIVYIISACLLVSVAANAYLLRQHKEPPVIDQKRVTTSSEEIAVDSPYGFRNEIVTVYENGKVKTYSTTTPITEKDIEQMRKRTEARLKAMDDYFREQEKFFRSFWYNF